MFAALYCLIVGIQCVFCSGQLASLLQNNSYTENGLKIISSSFECSQQKQKHGIHDSLGAFSLALPSMKSCEVSICNAANYTDAATKFRPTQFCIEHFTLDECGSIGGGSIVENVMPALKKVSASIPGSCRNIWLQDKSAQSGNYTIHTKTSGFTEVYCDMEGANCGGEGGWTRVGFFNMADSSSTCPSGLAPISYSNLNNQLCNKISPGVAGCDSGYFNTKGITFNKVCGRAKGYQFRSPDGFHPTAGISVNDIDGVYLDGVSITHGSNPRKHIWSFAGGLTEGVETYWHCPCNQNSYHSVPSFVGGDYYCESAVKAYHSWATVLYPDDPLWDGQDCGGSEGPCCTTPNMPWFVKTLDNPTSDDIELRVCSSQDYPDTEGTPLELVEIFIQ